MLNDGGRQIDRDEAALHVTAEMPRAAQRARADAGA